MADYEDLHGLFQGQSQLRNKVEVACAIKAADIVDNLATASEEEKAFARLAFTNPRGLAD